MNAQSAFLGPVLLLLVSQGAGAAAAQDEISTQARFERANTCFQKGDYACAEDDYRALLDLGVCDGNLYYNIGNTLYRRGRLADAILSWRRAELLLPRDPDIRANLEKAREKTLDALEPQPAAPAFLFWHRSISVAEGRFLGSFLLGAGFLSFILDRLSSRRDPSGRAQGALRVGGLALCVLGLLLGLGASILSWIRASEPVTIVLVEEVKARSTLGVDGVELFLLHQGAELRVAESAAGSVLAVLPDGRRGWLPESTVGLLDPEAPFPRDTFEPSTGDASAAQPTTP